MAGVLHKIVVLSNGMTRARKGDMSCTFTVVLQMFHTVLYFKVTGGYHAKASLRHPLNFVLNEGQSYEV